jgi:hypothetical protein
MIHEPVTVTINGIQSHLDPGGRLEMDMNGPVNLAGWVTGPRAGFYRPGQNTDGLVQDRMIKIEIDPIGADLRFTAT